MTHSPIQARAIGYRVAEATSPTPEMRIFRLEPQAGQKPLCFRAGQYIRLAAHDWPERAYSLASRPGDSLLEIHIRKTPGGTSQAIVDSLETGDSVHVTGPFGSAYLRDGHGGPILAIAGGAGLAPMKSIIETALAEGCENPIHLYFGARHDDDLYCREHFDALSARHENFHFHPVVMEAEGSSEDRQGLVTDAVAEDFDRLDSAVAYLAGPPPMIAAARSLLQERGLDEARIYCDDDETGPASAES